MGFDTKIIVAIAILAMSANISSAQSGTEWNYWSMKAWGANLGNWLVLERWMESNGIFNQYAPNAQDEWSFCQQASNPAQALQNHWNSWITEDDFRLLAQVQANHVRIPVGYWAFIQPDAGEPYVSYGQKAQLERILGYCSKYNIFAIIDLHGLPGSQNGEAHSGRIGAIEFFTDYNIQRSVRTVQAIVDWMNSLNPTLRNKIASIQSANEPRVNGANQLNILKGFYTQAYNIIHASPFKVPMMFHDAFQGLSAFSGFLPPPANAVIDLHPYHAFPPDTNTNSIINNICNTRYQSFHLPIFFGEWSLASGVPNSEWWLRQMMDTQISVFKGNGKAGGTFWALKNTINSNVWSFEQLVHEGIINAGTFEYHTNAQC